MQKKKGLHFDRHFTHENVTVYDQFEYSIRESLITDSDGKVVFQQKGVEVPKNWSQMATDILAQKYFRRAGVPQSDGTSGGENSIRQVVHRMAHCWKTWGEEYGYFATAKDAEIFYDELVYSLMAQMAAPNSPQWFNTGLHSSYGIKGKPQGHYYVDPRSGKLCKSTSAYERPQPHACFILSVEDDLVNDGGIMDLWVREARIFKYGSGVGTNFSRIRGSGEKLSGGGTSSGLMSFLKIGDRAAGAIKSGGTTRRAAKMVCLDLDHPEIMEFIQWKMEEEKKAAALISAGYSNSYEGEAYSTVSGQNSNNSVRIPNSFFEVLDKNEMWELKGRTHGETFKKVESQKVWDAIADAAWLCADPGLQFDTTINEWHTCPEGGSINASNPCSEYMFLDNTACNLASLNLIKFFDKDSCIFDVEGFEYASRLWTVVLEISVTMAQFPSKEVAQLSYEYRTLGLGYANLGTMLMVSGIPYNSQEAFAVTGAVTAILTGVSYTTSAEMAKILGPFNKFEKNRAHMMRVMHNHRYAAYNATEAYEGLSIKPQGIDTQFCPDYLHKAACKAWDAAVREGEKYGYRNAQATVIAPTGTIGLVMDCDSTGIEPDFSLVKFKKLSGGGFFRIVNNAVSDALRNLKYSNKEIESIIRYVQGTATLHDQTPINTESLMARGLNANDLSTIETQLGNVFHISFLFNHNTLGMDCLDRLGFAKEQYEHKDFNLLRALGYTRQEIEDSNEIICGTGTIEGAPYLKAEHYPIFDCANKCGAKGQRFLPADAHIRAMAAAQPFISGAISKTINLPNEATVDQIKSCYRLSWELGLKANALYRDGCKLSQPLNTKSDSNDSAETIETVDKVLGELANAKVSELPYEKVLEAVQEILNKANDRKFARELASMIERKRLPGKRGGFTQKAKVGGQTIFLRTGEYADGTLGEIFIDIHKEGASFRSMMNCFAIAVSIGLQYGVPLEEYVSKFTYTRFEPSGWVEGHDHIKNATSLVDYIFKLLGFEYLGATDLVQVPPTEDQVRNLQVNHHMHDEAFEEDFGTDDDNRSIGFKIPTRNTQPSATSLAPTPAAKPTHSQNVTQDFLKSMQSDAPSCNVCGHITVRSGSCYKCLNCGNSLGCS